ncbi:MAG: hypothetical protein DSY90_09420 [Deltaproteobacteria bacterium]|nr:MAG: hypothetical protein DSY90_09420 [Deltaproteobacteria bacterium]
MNDNKNRCFCLFFLAIILLLAAGCSAVMDGRGIKNIKEQERLEAGYLAFRSSDFKQAGMIFDSLQFSESRSIAQKAKYALVCIKWILADTPKAEKEAFDRWKKERKTDCRHTDCRERQLVESLLETLMSRLYEADPSGAGLNTTIARQYRKQLHLRDTAINQLTKKMKALKAENVLLKNKIKSIEEIDQKIQEKKADPPPRKRM